MNSHASQHRIGLYLHLPFCSRICHYCDFVKSALYTEVQKASYLRALEDLLDNYRELWHEIPGGGEKPAFSSVFWGGGTPSLVSEELRPIMKKIMAMTAPDAEITLEANPEHISENSLKIWRDIGINRLSLGVQSFQERGLKALTREHTRDSALRAIDLSLRYFSNINADLIYGWPDQTAEEWLDDLQTMATSGVTHTSLYNLTFEGNTPFARRLSRGKMTAMEDEGLFDFYQTACSVMRAHGFLHEEVSNWHKTTYEARHNGLYWHGGSYLGLGSGAHSFLENLGPYGTRYHQNGNWRTFVPEKASSLVDIMTRHYNSIDGERDAEAWVFETVSSGLRTSRGINITGIEAKSGYRFDPRPLVSLALEQGLLKLDSSKQLFLDELEWFRETQWSLELALSFVPRALNTDSTMP